MNDKSMIVGALALVIFVGAILYVVSGNSSPAAPAASDTSTTTAVASGPALALAQCLKQNGVVFYGAFWCPHCKAQKAEFGDAVPALPYVECSTPDGNAQTPICIQKNITSYPTWVFPDGSRLTGEQPLETLADKGSCTQALGSASSSPTGSPIPASTGAASNVN